MALYLVPVPIGNLGDITLRALELLKKAELIACEDTRKTAFLLRQYDIAVPRLISFHKFNERARQDELISYLESGKDLVVVSDAGSPALSDPAELLIREAIAKGIQVSALPGATALVPAITVAGFGTQPFQFTGFLPRKAKLRHQALRELARYPYPTVIYEAPHRMHKLLAELFHVVGDRQVCICREISKLHEEQLRGRLGDFIPEDSFTVKGEFVVVLGAPEEEAEPAKPSLESLEQQVVAWQNQGLGTREIAAQLVRDCGMDRKEAYQLTLSVIGKGK